MDTAAVLAEFQAAEAILKGHFVLSSGLHSDTYLQCARALMDPKRAERLCAALAAKIRIQLPEVRFNMVVSPAMGGVIVGYEMGRQLELPAIFCERENGTFTLRRGFSIPQGAKILMVEDVVTTGKSSLEAIACVQQLGGTVVAEACLINRSGTAQPIPNIPLVALAELTVQTYAEADVPAALAAVPVTKPGSRFLKA